MLFCTPTFFVFFISFFFLYWFLFNQSVKSQNLILLLANYVFYVWADWRFLSYLIGVSVLNYFLGVSIEKKTKYKKLLIFIGLFQGIGGLAFFKYFNFFITSFNDLFHSFNINLNLQTLNILVPLGISFFTFRTISYILDVDKGKVKATKDWLVFFNYVSFFPSVLSGPIDKAILFVPQLEKKRDFDYDQATDGIRQILWGLFKKLVIADNCSTYTTLIFDHSQIVNGSTYLMVAFLYAIQVYADFSGYSDMAIGFSRLLGFNISKNFDFPFFSQNIAEFWRKWHMSLTLWLTEYVFTPLSITFRDFGKFGLILAIVINFTICGIWHGANWTYVLFGFLHGCFFIPLILKGTMNKKKKLANGKFFPSFKELINVLLTFTLVMISFIIFRANTIGQAFNYFSNMVSLSLFQYPKMIVFVNCSLHPIVILILITFLLLIEWIGRDQQYAIRKIGMKWNIYFRVVFYYMIAMSIFLFSIKGEQFIYFQF